MSDDGGLEEFEESFVSLRFNSAIPDLASALFASQAYAGGNGQQIRFCGVPGNIVSVKPAGNNQDNQLQSIIKYINQTSNGRDNTLGGYWWTRLQTYTVRERLLDEWVKRWHTQIVPLRLELGFEIGEPGWTGNGTSSSGIS